MILTKVMNMNITWEDRKGRGKIDDQPLTVKPVFSFDYAWIQVNDQSAQYVENHDEGVYNKDLTEAEVSEILAFYADYVFDGLKPEFDSNIEKIELSQTIQVIEGKRYTSYDIVPLSELEISANIQQNIEFKKEEKRTEIRDDFAIAITPPVEALGFTWNSGFNSSLSIDGAARIAAAAGFTEVTIHSLDNKPHMLSLADATQVAVIIGGAYQQQLAIKQARMVAVDEVDINASDAIAQINLI
jgi:hypothetical protein